MDFKPFLVMFTMFWKMSSALNCYQCVSEFLTYRNEYLCDHFDYSDKYLVECSSSTMCYKKEIISNLGKDHKYYERGCAPQTMSDDQVHTEDKGWVTVKRIYEVYEEGCKESPGDPDRVTKSAICYCSGDLCNAAERVTVHFIVAITIASLWACS